MGRRTTALTFRGIITAAECDELFAKADYYTRTVPIRAVQIDRRLSVETRDGTLVTTQPGDYIVQDTSADKRPWVIRSEVFEQNFRKLTESEAAKYRGKNNKQLIPAGKPAATHSSENY
jgi:hypothetical protein